jgi:hypothetical protein
MRVTKDQTLSIAKNGHGAASEAIVAK